MSESEEIGKNYLMRSWYRFFSTIAYDLSISLKTLSANYITLLVWIFKGVNSQLCQFPEFFFQTFEIFFEINF